MVLADDLNQALKSLVACVDKRSTLAAEKSILIAADGKEMTLRSASGKGSLLLAIAATAKFEAIGVPFAALEKAIKASSSEEIDISYKKNKLVIASGRRIIRLRTIAASSFSPPLADDLFHPYSQTSGTDLAAALMRAVRVASLEGGTLGAISLTGGNKKLKIAATDRLRLFYCPIAAESEDSEELLINRDSCKLLGGAIKRVEDIEILKSEEAVRFRYGANVWTLPRLDGNFPRFDDLIPREGQRLLIDSEQLGNALGGVAAVARSGNLDPNSHIPVRLHISTEEARLRYKDSELGDMEERLPDLRLDQGEEQEIGFNGAFLADMLLALNNPVGLVNSPEEAVLFSDGDEIYLLMPVRLSTNNQKDEPANEN